MALSYAELLRDPRWQRKRLEIMGRDGFRCVECRSTTRTLNVHHRYYEKDRAPWEYPDSAFVTLCETCHERAEWALAEIRKLAGFLGAAERADLVTHLTRLLGGDRVQPPAPVPLGQRARRWKMFAPSAPPPVPQP